MTINMERALRTAINSGKVLFGANSAIKAAKHGEAKLIIISNNCPSDLQKKLIRYAELANLSIYKFKGTNEELGAICRRPHSISTLVIKDPGTSNILELGKKNV
jgi:large subunit ribosomal protein L30e